MKFIGDPLFARNDDGTLKSRIGTIFLRTPGLVTERGVHALQRATWIAALNAERQASGKPAMGEMEAADEMAESVDLIFDRDIVLIRPDPTRMDLAFLADEALQKIVSKRRIRFLNTQVPAVRNALQARGENWRMARHPLSPEEMDQRILSAKCAIRCQSIFYYNSHTGTRYITAGGYAVLRDLAPAAFRSQIEEIVRGLNTLNRHGQHEVDLFPTSLKPVIKARFSALEPEKLSDAELRRAADQLEQDYRAALPANLRDESLANFDWRNEMCHTLTRGPNETAAEEQALVEGISPEFYRQIEWLPGAAVERGRVIFDPLFEELRRTEDPQLRQMCDSRVRSIIFNLLRLFGRIEFVNVGRIARTLARHPMPGTRRGGVYFVQCKEMDEPVPRNYIIRFQKWGIAEHLDEGKDLLASAVEADQYADYILDRRLACRQLGMNLPNHVGFGQFTEPYHGDNQYRGTCVRANYFVRHYICGTASDKVPPARFKNPAFAHRFAELMGAAAALDLVVGRANSETHECVFDSVYEVVQTDAGGLPERLVVTDHAGSFVRYREPLEELAGAYARAVRRREKFVSDYAAFARSYVTAFSERLAALKAEYAAHPQDFENLFAARPFDRGGSMAYRWHCTLKRLAAADPLRVTDALKKALFA